MATNGQLKTALKVIGPPNLQNQLLASFLGQQLDIQCGFHEEWNPANVNGNPLLVLWDSEGLSSKKLMSWLDTRKLSYESGKIGFAFFNVNEELSIGVNDVQRGIRGLFCASETPEQLLKGVRMILQGEMWFPRRIMTQLLFEPPKINPPTQSSSDELTLREQEILAQLVLGNSNQDISNKFCISLSTVKSHTNNIFRKIGVTSRLQAALWAAKHL